MTLDPLLSAPQPIPVHGIAALVAMVLGGLQLWGHKGNPKSSDAGIYLGRIDGDRRLFRILHPCSQAGRTLQPDPSAVLLTLASLWYAIRAARRGDIKRHRQTMVALFWMALILTGFFTFWPGRVMYQVVTGA